MQYVSKYNIHYVSKYNIQYVSEYNIYKYNIQYELCVSYRSVMTLRPLPEMSSVNWRTRL